VEREEEVKPDSAFKGQSVGPKGVGFRVYPKPTKTEGQEVKGADKDEVRPNAEHTKKQQEGYLLMYPRYEKEYVESVKPRHKPPEQVGPSSHHTFCAHPVLYVHLPLESGPGLLSRHR